MGSTFITNNDHTTLNMKLPEELIRKIVSYLSMQDILHLCISKMFLPCFVNSPWFFTSLATYFNHLLAYTYSQSQNLFLLCAVYPAVVNNRFYIAVDHQKLPYFKKLFLGESTIFSLVHMLPVLRVWSALFRPYKKCKKGRRSDLKPIRSFPTCHPLCPCHRYRHAPFHAGILRVSGSWIKNHPHLPPG